MKASKATGRPEPAVTTGAVVALATAIIGVLVAYAVLDDGEAVAWTAIVAAVAPIVSGLLTRPQVTPVDEDPQS